MVNPHDKYYADLFRDSFFIDDLVDSFCSVLKIHPKNKTKTIGFQCVMKMRHRQMRMKPVQLGSHFVPVSKHLK